MNETKQHIINELIQIMTDNQDSAIKSLSMRLSTHHQASRMVHSTPLPAESIPSNRDLACFNVAAELANLMMNDVTITKRIVEKYEPGIVEILVDQHPTDYNNPKNVMRVIDDWLGIKTSEY